MDYTYRVVLVQVRSTNKAVTQRADRRHPDGRGVFRRGQLAVGLHHNGVNSAGRRTSSDALSGISSWLSPEDLR